MNRLCSFVIAALLLAFKIVADEIPPTGKEAGRALALDLRDGRPNCDSEISGVLKIRAGKRREEIPVLCSIRLASNYWDAIYVTGPRSNRGASKFVVRHQASGSNQYFYAEAPAGSTEPGEARPLDVGETSRPLAGSDFWLMDLALDFLHWPDQERQKGEMRLGRPCYVLESRLPAPRGGVARVKSWIDKETGGILVAEAYDSENHLVKEFSLSGSSFKKVNGQWELEEMKIRSPKDNSQTILKFDLPDELKERR
jgi:hypothetical protein